MSIAPPREHLELGDKIRYHHRVAVARWQTGKKKENGLWINAYPNYTPEPYWRLFEGVGKGAYYNGELIPLSSDDWSPFDDKPQRDIMPPRKGGRNKTLYMWPAEGSGVIIGLVRRGIGQSVSGYVSHGPDGSDYEPGYFAEEAWVWLYAVKTHISGTDYILVPMDAVQKIDDE